VRSAARRVWPRPPPAAWSRSTSSAACRRGRPGHDFVEGRGLRRAVREGRSSLAAPPRSRGARRRRARGRARPGIGAPRPQAANVILNALDGAPVPRLRDRARRDRGAADRDGRAHGHPRVHVARAGRGAGPGLGRRAARTSTAWARSCRALAQRPPARGGVAHGDREKVLMDEPRWPSRDRPECPGASRRSAAWPWPGPHAATLGGGARGRTSTGPRPARRRRPPRASARRAPRPVALAVVGLGSRSPPASRRPYARRRGEDTAPVAAPTAAAGLCDGHGPRPDATRGSR